MTSSAIVCLHSENVPHSNYANVAGSGLKAILEAMGEWGGTRNAGVRDSKSHLDFDVA